MTCRFSCADDKGVVHSVSERDRDMMTREVESRGVARAYHRRDPANVVNLIRFVDARVDCVECITAELLEKA